MGSVTRILVANRGEIARRVFRAARSMGVGTVAVYADSDAGAPFVTDADEAVALDGAASAETYLRIEKLLDAARRTGADAVHPGYGFLSERADFARAVIGAGLTWIGPSPGAITAMGDKLAAKRLMVEAGVPTLGSVTVEGARAADLARAVRAAGFPVLVKAAAGGGGRGMRIVEDESGLAAAVEAARREATAAFGDGTLFIERYVRDGRHIEVQVLADSHGNTVHLFERECSIQRRHQKIIEEAPSPAVDAALREQLGAAAVRAATAIGYTNAGTVEFIFSGGEFFFLEMNTRIQVEHPVTEEITGIDLVREQIRVARGEPLGYAQADVRMHGHAIEARLYAENPANNFLPSPGRLLHWPAPADLPARVESGVRSGMEVSQFFDAMLAKVVVYAPARDEAALRLARVLEGMRIHGVTTNRDFLVNTLRHPAFLAGDTTTHFIERHNPARSREVTPLELRFAAVAAALDAQERRHATTAVQRTVPAGWRNNPSQYQRQSYRHAGQDVAVGYLWRRDGSFAVEVNGQHGVARLHAHDGDLVELELDGLRRRFAVLAAGDRVYVQDSRGEIVFVEVPRFPPPGSIEVSGGYVAPMPGKVVQVAVSAGDHVAEGQLLTIIEAMKMEHRITCLKAGIVIAVHVAVEQQIDAGAVLVEIDTGAVG